MSDQVGFALASLHPQGIALKVHILQRLTEVPGALTTSQIVAGGGPRRNFASTWYALRALRRCGIVRMLPRKVSYESDRWQLAKGAKDPVLAFLAKKSPKVEQRKFTPLLRGTEKLRNELAIVCDDPEQWFTVKSLNKRIRHCAVGTVRKHMVELFENGYVLRRLTDPSKPGLPVYEYRLNSKAKAHARELL